MQGQSNISQHLGSEQTFTVDNSRAEEAMKMKSALNSASTMPEVFLAPKEEGCMVLAESSI